MPSVFETLAAGARQTFYDIGGVSVAYVRGAETVSLTAIPASQGNKWSDAVSAGIWAGVKTWTVKAADLSTLTDPYPQLNDAMTDSAGTQWRVVSPDGGPVFREIDGEGFEFEIHTKAYEVGT
jgi:hypothetical protein